MKRDLAPVLSFVSFALMLGCRPDAAPQRDAAPPGDASASAPPAMTNAVPPAPKPDAGKLAVGPAAEARGVVLAWNSALDSHDAGALEGLYADPVRFYGRSLPKQAVMAAKRAALAGKSTFHQQIVGDIPVTVNEKGKAVVADFQKHSTSSGKGADVRGRLGLRRDAAGHFVIEEETDDVTGNRCHVDKDCPDQEICTFVAGTTFMCSKPYPVKACPKGQVFLKSDGECWTTCQTDADCPEDSMCCPSDPNAPEPICIGSCPDP